LTRACKQVNARPDEVFKVTVAGNPTMMHLLLASRPSRSASRRSFPAVNHVPTLYAGELGLAPPQAW
jgi:hypothetical protein